MLHVWRAVRRVLIGAACVAALEFALLCGVARLTAGDGPSLVLAHLGFMAILGLVVTVLGIMAILHSVAAGSLSAIGTGWAMLAGAIVGAVTTGLCGVLVSLNLKGLIFSFLGGLFGALSVFLYRLKAKGAEPLHKARASQAYSGVWDAELDR
jgi:hypothetical protein